MPVFITEYAAQGRDVVSATIPVPQEPPLAEQTVAVGVSSAQSSAFNANTRLIRVSTDVVCSIAIGPNPTATATSRRLPANTTEYFAIPPQTSDGPFRLAAIQNT